MKAAPGGKMSGCRYMAWDAVEAVVGLVEAGQRSKEAFCIGMLRGPEQGADRGPLNNMAGVHDGHIVGHLGYDTEVVRDQENGHMGPGLDLAKQVENLGLNGHVEGGGGFVGNEEQWVTRQSHGDHGALAHPPRELMRVFVDARLGGRDAHIVKKLNRTLESLRLRYARCSRSTALT